MRIRGVYVPDFYTAVTRNWLLLWQGDPPFGYSIAPQTFMITSLQLTPMNQHGLKSSKQTGSASDRTWWNLNRISNVLKSHLEAFELPQPKVSVELWVRSHKISPHAWWGIGKPQKREEVEQLYSWLPFIFWNGSVSWAFFFPRWIYHALGICLIRLARTSLTGGKVINLSAQPWSLHKLSCSTLAWLLCSHISTMFFRTITLRPKN